jgi:hypothetical protein
MAFYLVCALTLATNGCDQPDLTLGEATRLVCDQTCLRNEECGSTQRVKDCSNECVTALCENAATQDLDCDDPITGDPEQILQCLWDVRARSCYPTASPPSCGELR